MQEAQEAQEAQEVKPEPIVLPPGTIAVDYMEDGSLNIQVKPQ